MNPFLLGPKARLEDWKDFRKLLTSLSESDQLQRVADYWAKAPLIKSAYNLDYPNDIPSPWEMISEGNWCADSVAIGMEFTLRLAGFPADRLQLALIRDYDISEMKVILIVDGDYVLNYIYDEIISYPETNHDIIDRWYFSGKNYTRINAERRSQM